MDQRVQTPLYLFYVLNDATIIELKGQFYWAVLHVEIIGTALFYRGLFSILPLIDLTR